MATSPASIVSWKLKESVKFMRITASKNKRTRAEAQSWSQSMGKNVGPRLVRSLGLSKDPSEKKEIKKWKKMDIYLFEYDIPVIKYCPTGSESSQLETIQLSDVILVNHIPSSSKSHSNVLTVTFPSYFLLLSFKSRSSMELWMSELLRLKETFTFLLYETSNSSIKLGYYRLRLVLSNFSVIVSDAVTKKLKWSWHITHICGHCRNKSGVKIEVGKESPTNGIFSFTGKQVELFCELVQMFGRNYAAQRSKSLPSSISSGILDIESTPFRKRSFAMQRFSSSNTDHEPNASIVNDDSLTDRESVSVFYESYSNNTSISHPVHALSKSIAKQDALHIGDSVSSNESVFCNNYNDIPSSPMSQSTIHAIVKSSDDSKSEKMKLCDSFSSDELNFSQSIAHSSLPIDHSMMKTSSRSDDYSKADEAQTTTVTVYSASLNKSQCDASLPAAHSKSLDDLLKINSFHKNTSEPSVCVSSCELNMVNDDSDDEDYVIPFLYNSDEDDGYVIGSLFSSTEYLTVLSNSGVDNYEEIKDLTLMTESLSTSCDDNFRTRSDSNAYDYVKDFMLPISPSSPSKQNVFELHSPVNHYEDIEDMLEMPTLSTCANDDHPDYLSKSADYEEVKDYLLS